MKNKSSLKLKILLMALLLAGCIFLTYLAHVIIDTGVVFTHLFYIPIILAALWWKRKGLVVAVILAALLIFSHVCLKESPATLYDYFRAPMFVFIAIIVAVLSERIAKTQERIFHLNTTLLSLQNVNKLITRENDRERLLQKVCDGLIDSTGYKSAWIALVDENREFLSVVNSGLDDMFSGVFEMMKRGELARCMQNVLKESAVKVFKDIAPDCAGCPLTCSHTDKASMVLRLEYGTRVYGILCVIYDPAEAETDAVEQSLFKQVSSDIAFGLHRIELERAREKAEEALRKLNNELKSRVEERTGELIKERDHTRHLIESSPDFQVIMDKNGKILDMNEAFEETLREKRKELIGTSIFKYLPKEDAEKFIAQVFEKKKVRNIKLTIDRSEKGALICNLSGTVYTTPRGELGVYLTGRDITELELAQEKLIRSERLAVLGQLAGGVGHELRNPLGVISNVVYYLKDVYGEDDEKIREYLQILDSEVRNAVKIVSDLLDLSRTRAAARERVEVSALVSRVFARYEVPEGVDVEAEVASDLPSVYVDPQQVEQVLLNLIANGCQAMEEGGGGVLSVSGRAVEGWVGLSVSDSGCGIPEEDMGRIFEPLFTTRARGIGLGLAVSKNLVEVNGGRIEVESEEGGGSTFRLFLPEGGEE